MFHDLFSPLNRLCGSMVPVYVLWAFTSWFAIALFLGEMDFMPLESSPVFVYLFHRKETRCSSMEM